jgi:hypothetical protein
MGLFSKFRENAVNQKEEETNAMDHTLEDHSYSEESAPEKGIMKSVGEMLQHSAQNVKEAVFGTSSEHDVGSLPCALSLEDPFNQSDNALVAVVERDLRSSYISSNGHEDVITEEKTIVQTVRENFAHSAHIVRDTVLGHSHEAEPNGHVTQVISVAEDVDSIPDEHRRSIMEAMGDMISHPVQTVKDIIGNNNNVVASSPIDSSLSNHDTDIIEEREKTVRETVSELLTQSGETVKEAVLRHTSIEYEIRSATVKQEPSDKPEEIEEDGELKGLMQSVKDAAIEVKEEMMEAVQEVKDAVMSSEPNVPESITEDAGERPSMELVHTIVHD